MTHYFQLLDDLHVPGRWYLTDPVDQQGREVRRDLISGKPVVFAGHVVVHFNEFSEPGRPLDYCELDAVGGSVPVVHVKVASVFQELAPEDVQLIPARIEGQPDQFYIVNVIRVVACIDDKRSRFVERYTEADGALFADQIGDYKSVRGMRINPDRVGDAKIFRTSGWGSIVVAGAIKEAMERVGTVGVKFERV